MEEDLKIYSKLSKRQYGFTKGASTETALHKLVHKIERAILNSGMALGTFLDIEGAFDNVAFHAIEKALNKKCSSSNTNNWIMSMIKSRSATVEIHLFSENKCLENPLCYVHLEEEMEIFRSSENWQRHNRDEVVHQVLGCHPGQ